MTVRPRRSFVLLLLLSLLVVLVLGAIYALFGLSRATDWLAHTDNVRVAIGNLRATLIDAETGARGYAVTGEREFLEPFDRALSNWRSEVDRVRHLTSDNPDQQRRLGLVVRLVGQHIDQLTRVRAGYDAGDRGGQLLRLMLEGKHTMDAARSAIDEMEQAEVTLDADRQSLATRQWQWTAALFIGGAFAFLLFIGVIWVQRQAEEARRRAVDGERRLLQAVLAGIDDGITLQDRDGKLIFANESAAKVIGFSTPQDLLTASGSTIMERFEVFGEDGRPFPPEKLPARAVIQGTVAEASVVVRHRRRGTRDERWSNVRAYPVLDVAGRVVQAINVFRDVTADYQAEARRKFLLRAVDELSSSLDYEATLTAVARLAVPFLADWCAVDIVDDGRPKRVATTHIDPLKIAVVEELERRYPSDPKSKTGVAEIIRSGEAQFLAEIPRDVLLAAAVDEQHLHLIDQLGLRSYLGVPLKTREKTIGAISLVMAESGRIYSERDLAFAQALADRAALAIENARLFKEVEGARATIARELAEEAERRRQAEGASRFAEMFVGMLGHDLRNPLNAVTMTANLLKRRAAGDDPAIDRILVSAQRMSNMVAQLLDLTRSRLGGGITVERQAIDLNTIIADVLDELRRAYPGRAVQWEKGREEPVLVDQDRMAQVVSNLVSNAIQHGDPAIPVKVELVASDDTVSLIVQNHGPPIPEQLLPVIFDPFRRTTARHERSTGLGLGLFISHQIVDAHEGRITVVSTVDAGTTFTVTLPRLGPVRRLASSDGPLIA